MSDVIGSDNEENQKIYQKGVIIMYKRKTVYAYIDGKKLIDVVQAALENNIMLDDMKKILIKENPGHTITFKIEEY